jgi:hypothetical protein
VVGSRTWSSSSPKRSSLWARPRGGAPRTRLAPLVESDGHDGGWSHSVFVGTERIVISVPLLRRGCMRSPTACRCRLLMPPWPDTGSLKPDIEGNCPNLNSRRS